MDVVRETVHLTQRGREFVGLCPFHPDRKPSLNVNPTKQIFKCFACGVGGDVFKFVQLRDRIDFREALTRLAESAGLDVSEGTPDASSGGPGREELRRVLSWASRLFQKRLHDPATGQHALDYARRRGLSDETIKQHGLGFAPDAWDTIRKAAETARVSAELLSLTGLTTRNEAGRTYDRFRNRLIFPIRDGQGRCVAFGGRTLGDDPAKYLNSPETSLFSKARILYGLDLARSAIQDSRRVIVVEGYTDVVLLHQFGHANVVGTLGTALTDVHVRALRPLADEFVLCFDGDEAGLRAADRAVEVSLQSGRRVRVALLPSGKDPADCVLEGGSAAFAAVLDSAEDALEFKWRHTKSAFGAGPALGSDRAALEAFLGFIGRLTTSGRIDALERGLLVRRLGDLLGISPEMVHDMLAVSQRRIRRDSPAVDREETIDAQMDSGYRATLRGLPRGLVSAVEDSFGLLVQSHELLNQIDDDFVAAVQLCPVWQRTFDTIQNLLEEEGSYAREAVLSRCDDGILLDFLSQAGMRVAGVTPTSAEFKAAVERVAAELALERMEKLQRGLRNRTAATAADEHGAFDQLLDMARRQHAVLAPEKRRIAPSAG